MLDAAPLPTTARELSGWVCQHPAIASFSAQAQAIAFLRSPPLPFAVQPGYRLLFNAAVATLPPPISEVIGLSPVAGARCLGQISVRGLRWALGSSPSWHLALVRSGAPVPRGRFRQPLRADALSPAAER